MDLEQIVLVAGAFFQAVAALCLLVAGRPTAIARPMAALLALNASVAFLDAAARAQPLAASWGGALTALDSFTWVFLVLTVVGANRAGSTGPLTWWLAVGLNLPYAALALAAGGTPGEWIDLWLRAAPYYVGTGMLLVVFSRRQDAFRWVALAFLPRALFFGALPLDSLWTGVFPSSIASLLDYFFRAVLLVAAGFAWALLLRPARGPRPEVVMAVALTGPILFLATRLNDPGTWMHLLNHASLSFVRPLVLLLGLALTGVAIVAQRAVALAAVCVVPAMLLEANGMEPVASMLVGLSASLALWAAWEVGRPLSAATTSSAQPDDSRTSGVDPPRWPQWLQVLGYLHQHKDSSPVERTQAAIAKATAIRVQRVSEALSMLARAGAVDDKIAALGAPPAPSSDAFVLESFGLGSTGRGPIKVYSISDAGNEWIAAWSARSAPGNARNEGNS